MPGVLSPTEHVLSARMSSKRAADAAPAAEATDDASTKRPRRDPDWSPGHQRMGMRTSETSETSRKRKQPADDVPANAAGASRATKQGRPAGWTPGCGLTYAQYRASQVRMHGTHAPRGVLRRKPACAGAGVVAALGVAPGRNEAPMCPMPAIPERSRDSREGSSLCDGRQGRRPVGSALAARLGARQRAERARRRAGARVLLGRGRRARVRRAPHALVRRARGRRGDQRDDRGGRQLHRPRGVGARGLVPRPLDRADAAGPRRRRDGGGGRAVVRRPRAAAAVGDEAEAPFPSLAGSTTSRPCSRAGSAAGTSPSTSPSTRCAAARRSRAARFSNGRARRTTRSTRATPSPRSRAARRSRSSARCTSASSSGRSPCS